MYRLDNIVKNTGSKYIQCYLEQRRKIGSTLQEVLISAKPLQKTDEGRRGDTELYKVMALEKTHVFSLHLKSLKAFYSRATEEPGSLEAWSLHWKLFHLNLLFLISHIATLKKLLSLQITHTDHLAYDMPFSLQTDTWRTFRVLVLATPNDSQTKVYMCI